MKKIVFLLSLCICGITTQAQNEVSLVVSADGATKTQAIDNALRSAIEQSFGTFVSANTEILNDELVKDEISTVSSGNIQKYTEVTSITLPNGNTSVTLNVTVSLKKLVSYAQSKGSQCEFAGATFGANRRLYEFNRRNEQIAIQNMIKQLDALRPIYDFEVEVAEPKMNDDNMSASVEIKVIAKQNDKTKMFNEIVENTLVSLAMTEEQAAPLISSGFKVEKYDFFFADYSNEFKAFKLPPSYNNKVRHIWLCNEDILKTIGSFFREVLYDYALTDNLNDLYIGTVMIDTTGYWLANGHIEYAYDRQFYYLPDGKRHSLSSKSLVLFTNGFCVASCDFIIPMHNLERITNINITATKESSSNIIIPYCNDRFTSSDYKDDFYKDWYKEYSFYSDIDNIYKASQSDSRIYLKDGIAIGYYYGMIQSTFISGEDYPYEKMVDEIAAKRKNIEN